MRIKGSGGGGPSNAKANLVSTDAFEIIMGVCEGEIGGIVGDTPEEKLQHVYLDDTPLMNSSGNYNFEESELLIRFEKGTTLTILEDPAGQTPIWYVFEGSTQNQIINNEVRFSAPQTIVTPAVPDGIDRIEVQITIPQLFRSTDDGVKQHTLRFRVVVNQQGGGYSKTLTKSFKGKTAQGGFSEEVFFQLPERSSATDRFEITVVKLDEDEDDDNGNTLVFRGYELITARKSPYGISNPDFTDPDYEYHPNTSMMHLVGVLGQQLSGIPTINADYKGLLCRVPSNYDPITKTYNENTAWDGLFKEQKVTTDNPLWVALELFTNTEFGAIVANPNIRIDKYSVYEKAKYADGYNPFSNLKDLVDPISGNTEVARFTFNAVLQDRKNGMEFINQILATCFAIAIDHGDGDIQILMDMPDVPIAMITGEMCVGQEGIKSPFTYTYTSINERVNAISTSYIDSANEYITQYLPEIRDDEAIVRYGLNATEIPALGTTTAWEAQRKALVFLTAAQTEFETVSFQLPMYGIQYQLYDLIYVYDPNQGRGVSGRIISSTVNAFTVRDPIYFAEAGNYVATVKGLSVNYTFNILIRENEVNTPMTQFLLAALFPDDTELSDYPVVAFENAEGSEASIGFAKPYRIAEISPSESNSHTFNILATEVNLDKHTEADLLNQAVRPVYSYLSPPSLDKVTNLTVTEEKIIRKEGASEANLWISWDYEAGLPFGSQYEVVVSRNGSPQVQTFFTSQTFTEIQDLAFGEYEIKVRVVKGDEVGSYTILEWVLGRVVVNDLNLANTTVVLDGSFENNVLHVEAEILHAAGTGLSPDIPLVEYGYLKGVHYYIYDNSTGSESLLGDFFVESNRLSLTASQFLKLVPNNVTPSELVIRVRFVDTLDDVYPDQNSAETTITLTSSLAVISNLAVTRFNREVGTYQVTWVDNSDQYVFSLYKEDNLIFTRQSVESIEFIDLLPVGNYRITVQPFSNAKKYGAVATLPLVVTQADTLVTIPLIVKERGTIRITPPTPEFNNEKYEFRYSTVDDFDNAIDVGSSLSLIIPNTVAGQTYYIWYRLMTHLNDATTWEKITTVGEEQVLYTWEVYADDDQGTGLSLSRANKSWKGLSSGHTTPTPDLIDPTIYNYVPIEQGSRWLTGNGEPDNSLGINGNYYLDVFGGNVYFKSNGVWNVDGNLSGTDGDKWFNGTDEPPAPALGKTGDNYLVVGNGNHYVKGTTDWVLVGSLKGLKGDKPVLNEDYFVGETTYVSTIFKNAENRPETPQGGSFGGEVVSDGSFNGGAFNGGTDENALEVIPLGWTDDEVDYVFPEKRWKSTRVYKLSPVTGEWYVFRNWVQPKLGDAQGKDGTEGTSVTATDDGNGTVTIRQDGVVIGTISNGENAPIPTYTPNPDGSVTVNPNDGSPTFTIPAGDDGEIPQLGIDYFIGETTYVSVVFANSVTRPDTPTGGSFDGTNEVLPAGVTDNEEDYTPPEKRWKSRRIYTTSPVTGVWSVSTDWTEFKLGDASGEDGSDAVTAFYDSGDINENINVSTNEAGANVITFDAEFDAQVILVVKGADFEGGVRCSLNGDFLGSMTGTDNETKNYTFYGTATEGTNTFRIWSNNTDGGALLRLRVTAISASPDVYQIRYPNGLALKDNGNQTVSLEIVKIQFGVVAPVTTGDIKLYDGATDLGYSQSFGRPDINGSKVIQLKDGSTVLDAVTIIDVADGEDAVVGTIQAPSNTHIWKRLSNGTLVPSFADGVVEARFFKAGQQIATRSVTFRVNSSNVLNAIANGGNSGSVTYTIDGNGTPTPVVTFTHIASGATAIEKLLVTVDGTDGDGRDGSNVTATDNGNGTISIFQDGTLIGTISDGNPGAKGEDGENGDDAPIPTYTQNGDGSVTVNPNNGDPSFTIPAGDDGTTPQLGVDYFNGLTGSFNSFIYRNGTSPPVTPTGGTFNGTTETFPSNTTDRPNFVTGQVTYISQTRYVSSRSGSTITWSNSGWTPFEPFIIEGPEGAPGASAPDAVFDRESGVRNIEGVGSRVVYSVPNLPSGNTYRIKAKYSGSSFVEFEEFINGEPRYTPRPSRVIIRVFRNNGEITSHRIDTGFIENPSFNLDIEFTTTLSGTFEVRAEHSVSGSWTIANMGGNGFLQAEKL